MGKLPGRRRSSLYSVLAAWAIAAVALIYTSAISPVAAQSTPHVYRIATGDKLAVTVFGQPDLSTEGTVDQGGNLRLPIVGDVAAVSLTAAELETSIGHLLEKGYVRRPVVSVKVAEFRPIYVLGMVRVPGLYAYQQGQSVLAAIARAGGFGAAEQTGSVGDVLMAEERVRLLEISYATFLAKRSRLLAQINGQDLINFPDLSGLPVDRARIDQIRDGERRAFMAERQAEQQETEALQKQVPRLQAEIASLKEQSELEIRQRELHKQLIADYEHLSKSGLARRQPYIEVKREEARIEGNIERLKWAMLKAEQAIGDVQFRITELHNLYQRRAMTELRETDRSLLELTVTLPSAQRIRVALTRNAGWMSGQQALQMAITVVRATGVTTVKYDEAVTFVMQPGDVVHVTVLAADQASVSKAAD
jgi:polysaccharide export outer membrane protein